MVRRDEEQWDPLDSLGKSGATVARNIRLIRKDRGLAYTELAARLKVLGREIPTWGLRKIESGGRRVDADDLVALALALGVSPSTLLIPKTETGDDLVAVTGVDSDIEARRLWRWLLAEYPLDGDAAEAVFGFVLRANPGWRLGREINLVESGIEPNVTRSVRIEGKEETLRENTDGNDK